MGPLYPLLSTAPSLAALIDTVPSSFVTCQMGNLTLYVLPAKVETVRLTTILIAGAPLGMLVVLSITPSSNVTVR